MKVFEHFANGVSTAVGSTFTDCPIQLQLLRRGCNPAQLLCLSVRHSVRIKKKKELLLTTIKHSIEQTA
jgi:hypothetical protein